MGHPFHYFTPGIPVTQLAPGLRFKAGILAPLHLGHLEHLTAKGQCPGLAFQEANLNGMAGALFTLPQNGDMAPVVSIQDGQSWLQQGDVWIGWEKDDPPGPAELQRRPLIPGYTVECDGGQEWIIPIVKSSKVTETIPHDLEWDLKTGEAKPVRAARYDEIWEIVGDLQRFWNGEDTLVPCNDQRLFQAALMGLQLNYCISQMELNAFRAMGRTVINEVRAATIGMCMFNMEVVKDLKKKTDG